MERGTEHAFPDNKWHPLKFVTWRLSDKCELLVEYRCRNGSVMARVSDEMMAGDKQVRSRAIREPFLDWFNEAERTAREDREW